MEREWEEEDGSHCHSRKKGKDGPGNKITWYVGPTTTREM